MSHLVAVIGGGLLGQAVSTEASRRGHTVELVTGVHWQDASTACSQAWDRIDQATRQHTPERVTIAWCAGGGSVAADPDAMARETDLLTRFVARARDDADRRRRPSVFAFASSGGAVWSGSDARVLTESTPPASAHPYGDAKLAQEAAITEATLGSPWLRSRLARISNLYGPVRAGRRPRGLPETLVASALDRTPASIYVPLDTTRDYVFVTQAARLMLDDADDAFEDTPGHTQVDVVAAGASHTIAHVVRTLEHVLRRRVPLTVGMSWLASRQPRTLTFRSTRRDLAAANAFPLAAGLRAVIDSRLAIGAR